MQPHCLLSHYLCDEIPSRARLAWADGSDLAQCPPWGERQRAVWDAYYIFFTSEQRYGFKPYLTTSIGAYFWVYSQYFVSPC